jgi:hypothetical protein
MGKERRDHKETLRLLDCLKGYGFDNSAFSLLHFKPNHTIQEHCEHCQRRVKQFKDGDDNSKVQHRLEIVLGAYKGGGFTARRSPSLFRHLAWEALVEVPMNPSQGASGPGQQHAVSDE